MKKTLIILFLIFILASKSNAQNTRNEIVIGEGTELNNGYPVFPAFSYTYSQTIYLQSEVGGADVISKIWYKYGGSSLENSNNWTIYMGHTSKNQFDSGNDWIDASTLTQVYSGIFTAQDTGWIEFDISDFNYNGTDNLVIAVDENSDDNDSFADNYFYTTDVSSKRSIMERSDSNNYDPNSPPDNAYFEAVIPNIKLFKGEYPAVDAKILEINSPLKFTWTWESGNEDVKILLQNKGTSNLSSATINWSVNGVSQTPYSWSGNLSTDATEIVTIGNFDFSSANTYNITAQAVAENDGNHINDSNSDIYTVLDAFRTPFSEDFENYEYPNTPDFWATETHVKAWIVDDRISHWGDKCLRTFFNEDNAKDDWAFTPYIRLVGGSQYEIEFWLQAFGYSGVGESLELYVGSDTTSASMTQKIWYDNDIDTSSETDGWQMIKTHFTPSETANYIFGYHANSVADLNDIAIDDFSVTGETANISLNDNVKINIFPNPTNQDLFIETKQAFNLEIIDISGKMIQKKGIKRNTKISIYKKGVFFLKFINENETIVKKIIVN